MLTGPVAFSTSTDPVAPAKVIVDYAKTNEKLEIVGGDRWADTLLDVAGVKALADAAVARRAAREDRGAARAGARDEARDRSSRRRARQIARVLSGVRRPRTRRWRKPPEVFFVPLSGFTGHCARALSYWSDDQWLTCKSSSTICPPSPCSRRPTFRSCSKRSGASRPPPPLPRRPPSGGGAAAPVAEEQTEFDVILTGDGGKKINVIKEVRAITAARLDRGEVAGRERAEGRQGRHQQGRGREDQGPARGRRRDCRAQVSRSRHAGSPACATEGGGRRRSPLFACGVIGFVKRRAIARRRC